MAGYRGMPLRKGGMGMAFAARGLALALMTLMAGCGTLSSNGSGAGRQSRDLLAFYRYAAALEDEELNAEYRRFRNWTRQGVCTPDRIRLAMLVMQAESGKAAQAGPGAVLEPCLEGSQPPPASLRNLAFLLRHQASRCQQAEARLARLEDRLKAEKRRRQEVKQASRQLQDQVKGLRQQLEALKSIERSIRQQ